MLSGTAALSALQPDASSSYNDLRSRRGGQGPEWPRGTQGAGGRHPATPTRPPDATSSVRDIILASDHPRQSLCPASRRPMSEVTSGTFALFGRSQPTGRPGPSLTDPRTQLKPQLSPAPLS